MKHIPKIHIEAISHRKQRYPTCGDYFRSKKGFEFKISKTKADYEFLILIHELVEWYLTQKKGVKIEEIDEFDRDFEENRKEGDVSEPGNYPRAPYFQEHQFATKLEKLLAEELNINWNKYEDTIDSL